MKKDELDRLPMLKDCVSFLYIEMATIEQDEFSICIRQGRNEYRVPITEFASLLLGPGVSITHAAMKNIANAGTVVIWCKRNMDGFYTAGRGRTGSSQNLIMQAKAFADPDVHLRVVRNMYRLRFPDKDTSTLSIRQMQGMEGKRMQDLYESLAEKYNVDWTGRNYDVSEFDEQDDINIAISIGNAIVHDIVHAFLLILGFSTDLGFIHTGNIDSFVYDVADLYKSEISIPLAFEVASFFIRKDRIEKLIREKIHDKINEYGLLSKFPRHMKQLFDGTGAEVFVPNEFSLWTPSEFVNARENKYISN